MGTPRAEPTIVSGNEPALRRAGPPTSGCPYEREAPSVSSRMITLQRQQKIPDPPGLSPPGQLGPALVEISVEGGGKYALVHSLQLRVRAS